MTSMPHAHRAGTASAACLSFAAGRSELAWAVGLRETTVRSTVLNHARSCAGCCCCGRRSSARRHASWNSSSASTCVSFLPRRATTPGRSRSTRAPRALRRAASECGCVLALVDVLDMVVGTVKRLAAGAHERIGLRAPLGGSATSAPSSRGRIQGRTRTPPRRACSRT